MSACCQTDEVSPPTGDENVCQGKNIVEWRGQIVAERVAESVLTPDANGASHVHSRVGSVAWLARRLHLASCRRSCMRAVCLQLLIFQAVSELVQCIQVNREPKQFGEYRHVFSAVKTISVWFFSVHQDGLQYFRIFSRVPQNRPNVERQWFKFFKSILRSMIEFIM